MTARGEGLLSEKLHFQLWALQVIAHRIDTIMDCDQLLVLSSGRLVEQGPPTELASRPGGAFARLTQAARSAAGQQAPIP